MDILNKAKRLKEEAKQLQEKEKYIESLELYLWMCNVIILDIIKQLTC